MGLNRDKFRNIVSGITTPEPSASAVETAPPAIAPTKPPTTPVASGQGGELAGGSDSASEASAAENRRFAKRGRPKGRKEEASASKGRKVKVSLFLSETLVNDLYEWAHADRIHPGEMFERALKPFHEKEAKRRGVSQG